MSQSSNGIWQYKVDLLHLIESVMALGLYGKAFVFLGPFVC